jgi:hypothetical protein
VTDLIGIDCGNALLRQHGPHQALPRGEATTEYPVTVLSSHVGRR